MKKTYHAVSGLDVAGRLVDNVFYVKLTEDQVRISLNKYSYVFFRDFSFSPLFLKVHKNSHSMVKWLFFLVIENIQIHHCICLLFILPFEIGFALSGILFFEKMWFCHLFSKCDILKRNLNSLKLFLTFASLGLVLLWQLCYLFCSSVVINTVIVTAGTFEP